MLLNARNDRFKFNFPKNFVPDEIEERWKPYIERIPTPIGSVQNFINFTIQGINTSSLSYDPAVQSGTTKRAERQWLASTPTSQTSSKELTVTLRLVDGYANYFMLVEVFDYWYSFYQDHRYLPPFTIYTTDGDGVELIQFDLEDVLFTGIQELSLNYSDNVQQFNSFDASFVFNRYNIKFPFD